MVCNQLIQSQMRLAGEHDGRYRVHLTFLFSVIGCLFVRLCGLSVSVWKFVDMLILLIVRVCVLLHLYYDCELCLNPIYTY